MKRLVLILSLLLALVAFPALAQETTHTVAFDGFSFSFPDSMASSVSISQYPGDPTTLDQPGGPQARHAEFVLYHNAPAPESFFEAAGGVRVYNTADFAGYEQSAQQLQLLQTLIAQRPDLAQYMTTDLTTTANNLPFLPVVAAAQVLRARAHYVDTPNFQGVSYVTVYRQDVYPFTASEFRYVFQGISTDGSTYVSANFPLNTALFPAEIAPDFDMDTFSTQFEGYLNESIATLNNATPEDFAPSLATLDSIIQSFALTGAPVPGGEATAAPPEITPTATVVGDPTMGGLAGETWQLVAYGSPDSPQAAQPGTTIVFDQTGVSGNAGCNSYSGSFQYDNTTLVISNVISTLMACADEALMNQETAFLAALQTATSFQLNGSQLQVFYDGGVLTFTDGTDAGNETRTAVPGVTWRLTSYGSPDNSQPALDNPPVTLAFDPAGSVSGSAGCNSYNGPYTGDTQAAEGTLSVGAVVTTKIACEQPIMDQENAFLSALQSATNFSISNNQLQVFYGGGVLNFTTP